VWTAAHSIYSCVRPSVACLSVRTLFRLRRRFNVRCTACCVTSDNNHSLSLFRTSSNSLVYSLTLTRRWKRLLRASPSECARYAKQRAGQRMWKRRFTASLAGTAGQPLLWRAVEWRYLVNAAKAYYQSMQHPTFYRIHAYILADHRSLY